MRFKYSIQLIVSLRLSTNSAPWLFYILRHLNGEIIEN
jgi:hypothetical protein